jgi:hypothetical protein
MFKACAVALLVTVMSSIGNLIRIKSTRVIAAFKITLW